MMLQKFVHHFSHFLIKGHVCLIKKLKFYFKFLRKMQKCSIFLTSTNFKPFHSGGKCDVIGPKKHVPMGTKVGKVPNKLHQQHLHNMWTFRPEFFWPHGSPGETQSSKSLFPWIQKKIFWLKSFE